MGEIKRYDSPTGIMDSCDEGDWILFTDHEAALAAAQAEVDELKKDNAHWLTNHTALLGINKALADRAEKAKAEFVRAKRTLLRSGFEDHGGEEWKPPVNIGMGNLWRRVFDLESEVEKLKAERDEAVNAIKAAYRKHCMNDDYIGWEELGLILLNTLCNILGDNGYQEWQQSLAAKEVEG